RRMMRLTRQARRHGRATRLTPGSVADDGAALSGGHIVARKMSRRLAAARMAHERPPCPRDSILTGPVGGQAMQCYAVPRQAASAASARVRSTAKNAGDWPMNSPSAVKALTVATAAPAPTVAVGRMIDTAGNLRLRKA